MIKNKISGIITALVTPFRGGQIDRESWRSLLKFQYESGIKGFVINGTTGESPTLTIQEIEILITDFFNCIPDPNCFFILGSGTNSTRTTIELSQKGKEWGASALLVVVPYYNKPSQEGLYQHFKMVHDNIDLPIILYNVPGRTITTLEINTVLRLSLLERIIGIKEASGDLDYQKHLQESIREDFIFLSGDDGNWEYFLRQGGQGVISVLSNVFPKEMKLICDLLFGKREEGLFLASQYHEFIRLLFLETNPCPIKTSLLIENVIHTDDVRLPLVPTTPELRKKLEESILKIKKNQVNS